MLGRNDATPDGWLAVSLSWLRPDLPRSYAFSVTELPHRAKLDQNEAALDLPEELKRSMLHEAARADWNRYLQPDEYLRARRALAEVVGVEPEWISIMAGADQALEAAFLIGGGPGRRARWFEPTYPYVAHAARRTGTTGEPAVLGADIDTALDAAAASADIDVIALVSPNNPTGGLVPDEVVEAALASERRLVILDEAYVDYSRASWIDRIGDHPNLVIVRSLSKSSLAWVHLGYVIAHPEAVAMIDRMYTGPYHLNGLQLIVARRYPEIYPHVRAGADEVIAERARLLDALGATEGVRPYPSRASFILFRVEGPPERAVAVHRAIAEAGVRIRDVGALPGLGGHLRVTLGRPGDNDLFLDALRRAL